MIEQKKPIENNFGTNWALRQISKRERERERLKAFTVKFIRMTSVVWFFFFVVLIKHFSL